MCFRLVTNQRLKKIMAYQHRGCGFCACFLQIPRLRQGKCCRFLPACRCVIRKSASKSKRGERTVQKSAGSLENAQTPTFRGTKLSRNFHRELSDPIIWYPSRESDQIKITLEFMCANACAHAERSLCTRARADAHATHPQQNCCFLPARLRAHACRANAPHAHTRLRT